MQRIELKNGFVLNRIQAYNLAVGTEDRLDITGNQVLPLGLYGYCQRDKCTIQFSGFGSRDKAGEAIRGYIENGEDKKILEEGRKAAKGACLNFLNNLTIACDGHLDGVRSISLLVNINCGHHFKNHAEIADGASQLLINVFGKFTGMPARTATGSSSLPNGMMVEITATVFITKELAAMLDIRDAKNLADILFWTNKLIKSDVSDNEPIVEMLPLPPSILLKNHAAHLCDTLEKLNIEINADTWNTFAKRHLLLEKIESKQELIDLLSYKAKNLHISFREEKLSKYSSLYGAATKAREAFTVEGNNASPCSDTNVNTFYHKI